ncbi:MAG: HlyD family secretion protein [Bacteroidales bacterium]
MDANLDKKKKRRFIIPVAGITVIVLITAGYYYKEYARYITTDDARVEADNVALASKIMGRIAVIHVKEGDTVAAGQLLVQLDSTDLLAQKQQARAQNEQALSGMRQAEARLSFDKESIKIQEVNLERAKEDMDRAKEQFAGNVLTREQFDHIKKNFETAEALLKTAKAQVAVSQAQVESAHAASRTTVAQLGVVSTQLSNTSLYSPLNGVVARRWLLAGDIAQPGQSVLTLTDHNRYWVSIYLEETKLSQVHLGQKVIFFLDAYPGVRFMGTINYISANTAGQFSLIPPNNAAGNFTKVTQRVQIKCSLDNAEGYKDLSSFRFLSGMSAEVKIIKE